MQPKKVAESFHNGKRLLSEIQTKKVVTSSSLGARMKETVVLSVAGLLLTNALADALYRKRVDGALGQLSFGFLLAAAIVPAEALDP